MIIIWLYKTVSDRAYIYIYLFYFILLYYFTLYIIFFFMIWYDIMFYIRICIYIYIHIYIHIYIYIYIYIYMVKSWWFPHVFLKRIHCLWWSFSEVQGGQELQQAESFLASFEVGESAFSLKEKRFSQLNSLDINVYNNILRNHNKP